MGEFEHVYVEPGGGRSTALLATWVLLADIFGQVVAVIARARAAVEVALYVTYVVLTVGLLIYYVPVVRRAIPKGDRRNGWLVAVVFFGPLAMLFFERAQRQTGASPIGGETRENTKNPGSHE